jgi:phosphatidylglycerol:prolipoprotein diacylglycerol transferase
VAFCLPFKTGGEYFPIFWYGILAAVGIMVGAYYAQRHVEAEGGDPDTIWDMLLFVLPAGLLGARLWYVMQIWIAGNLPQGFTALDVFNPRQGGMNIFGGAIFGLVTLVIYARVRKLSTWLLADAALLGLLLGQGIGRFGNLINIELYGPPTGSAWFGILVPAERRLGEFAALPADTRFHPTMLYEAAWLFIVFGVLYYIFQKYQARIVPGVMAGAYLILSGVGRFLLEYWRPDQPRYGFTRYQSTGAVAGVTEISAGQIWALLYVIFGLVLLLDRLGRLRVPLWPRPMSGKERVRYFETVKRDRRLASRRREREKEREERRRQRRSQREAGRVAKEAPVDELQQQE